MRLHLPAFIISVFSGFAQWWEQHMIACPVKHFLHIDCPGCGLQRAWILLLRGNLWQSLQTHPAGIPLALFILYALLHLAFKFSNGGKIIVRAYLAIVIIVAVNYILKITNHH